MATQPDDGTCAETGPGPDAADSGPDAAPTGPAQSGRSAQSTQSGQPGQPAHPTSNTEYRIAHLGERLAGGDLAELGMRIESRGDSVHITGTASTAHDREAILRLAAEELPGIAVRADIALADVTAPDHPEDLS
ncbi:BON domain-containing protein [Streptomyces ossamyceticus]|uniref:BON domain-containing protein n=1 Tax=Streptomyces ossamyceticus TaxID=249581 RepID=UPI003441B046